MEEFDVKKIIKDNVALDLVLKQGRNLSKIAHLIDLSDESSSSSSDSEEQEIPVELTVIDEQEQAELVFAEDENAAVELMLEFDPTVKP